MDTSDSSRLGSTADVMSPEDAVMTPGQRKSKAATTSEPVLEPRSLRERFGGQHQPRHATPLEPFGLVRVARAVYATGLSVLCLLTVGGAIVMLLAWQQERSSGVLLSTQLERLWDLFDLLAAIERIVAFATLGFATFWVVMATWNLNRATGKGLHPVVAAASLLVGVFGVWIVGDQLVGEADNNLAKAGGIAVQAVCLVLPLLALQRVALASEAKHQSVRFSFVLAIAYLALLESLGALSTIDRTTEIDGWGRTGANLVIVVLVQALGALAANEAGRAIEEGTQNRYDIRHRFGESLLASL
ncbi:MAG TPA: hypothetical protein VMM60_17530 [Ilumatobacter sp.]|nr:hypothetical protein [Ilumatobacter sp.]